MKMKLKPALKLTNESLKVAPKVNKYLPRYLADAKKKKVSESLRDYYERIKANPNFKATPHEALLLAIYAKLFSIVFKQDPFTAPVTKHEILIIAILSSESVIKALINVELPGAALEHLKKIGELDEEGEKEFTKILVKRLAQNAIVSLNTMMTTLALLYFNVVSKLSSFDFYIFCTAALIVTELHYLRYANQAIAMKAFIASMISSAIFSGILTLLKSIIEKAARKLREKRTLRNVLLILLALAILANIRFHSELFKK